MSPMYVGCGRGWWREFIVGGKASQHNLAFEREIGTRSPNMALSEIVSA